MLTTPVGVIETGEWGPLWGSSFSHLKISCHIKTPITVGLRTDLVPFTPGGVYMDYYRTSFLAGCLYLYS